VTIDLRAPSPADADRRDDDPGYPGVGDTAGPGEPGPVPGDAPPPAGRSRARRAGGAVLTVLAAFLVVGALLAPDGIRHLTPQAFVRLPVEALAAVAVVLVLRGRARTVVAGTAGALLGVLLIQKCLDVGFSSVLARPFHVMFDWALLRPGFEFLTTAVGTFGGIAAAVGITLLVIAVPVVTALSALRLTRLVVRHDRVATGTVAALGVVWVVAAVAGAEIVPGVPVADRSSAVTAWKRGDEAVTDVRDQQIFAREAAVDRFRDVPGDRLLTGLRGKDVVLAFVESYGRTSLEEPAMAAKIDPVLAAGWERLRAAGYGSRSAWLTSSTAGGASWLAHGTILSGLRIDTSNRYRSLVKSDRLTLNNAFRRAGWRSVAAVPGVTRDWPEASFFGYDQVYAAKDLGYAGPAFGWASMPDQFTLQQFQQRERTTPGGKPVFAEIPLVSSHAPWAKVPRLQPWDRLGDGSLFDDPAAAEPKQSVNDTAGIRAGYATSVAYSLESVLSYVETYGDDDLVVVFLGDHQPAPLVTGADASKDVPITIVAKDPRVLDRIGSWGWTDGLRPGGEAPVWPMEAFRDRFLTAYDD
jgi:hypothetical protein